MSSRIRVPERESDFSWEEPYRSRPRGGGGGSRRRPPARRGRGSRPKQVALPLLGVALVVGLLIGFLAGGSGGTTTVTETTTVTTEAAVQTPVASGPGSRGSMVVAVLNGSDEDGLAARTADEIRAMGYTEVTSGNAPGPVTTDRVLYRPGAEPQALQVAADMGITAAPRPLADASGAAEIAPEADVVVLLGPSGDAGPAADGETAEAFISDTPAGEADVTGVSSGTAP